MLIDRQSLDIVVFLQYLLDFFLVSCIIETVVSEVALSNENQTPKCEESATAEIKGESKVMMHQWNVTNSEGTVIKKVYTGSKSIKIASAKVKARLGDLACFARLEYVGELPMKLEPIAKSLA